MLKFCYVSDLHGAVDKYNMILQVTIDRGYKILHIGADLLPKGSGILEIQKKFVNGYLEDFYKRCKENGIDVLATFGNDDLKSRLSYFKKYATPLDEVPYHKDGYEFKSYPFVQDYPFGIKDWCKYDYPGWKLQEGYISSPVQSGPNGLTVIEDIDKYFAEKGTIQEDLDRIQVTNRTIMAIHQPPYGLDLDVCIGGRRVGSKAVYEFIKATKPLICCGGHIHESYEVTGVWRNYIGKTMVIQPGQYGPYVPKVRAVEITLDGDSVTAELLDIPT